ncbi:Hydrogenase/urease accessory protein HupE [Paenibacillus sp. 1_12]|uniref:HupE/UreJ family protein n=1 Tax=Paenibacillus sp. 1_12 TaxID=1566278 RepID=UPI0008EEA2F3|nr:HupE/UreJ family protein [Paenibacillus sp. 1_12]SFK99868.1 Hydrogenase/urease accessory protein HupE [Paenibacillus sp. 1_12]
MYRLKAKSKSLIFRRLYVYLYCLLFGFVLIFSNTQTVQAHAYSASYTTLNFTKSQTEMTYVIDELSVIELTDGDVNHNGMLDPEEFKAVQNQIESVIKENVTLKINGEPQTWLRTNYITLNRQGEATQLTLNVVYPAVLASQAVTLTDRLYETDTKTNYVNLLTIHYGTQKSTSALSGKNRTWSMMLSDSAYAGLQDDLKTQGNTSTDTDKQSQDVTTNSSEMISGWLSFFKLGINHILTGYDHLLFLLALLIARQSFKKFAQVITAFTIAHSLTLTLSVLGWLDVSPQFVEPAIAFSICYVALENIFRKNVNNRWILTFLFGLIHGMGFADILKEMNIPTSELAIDLASFNIGIEVVQLVIVIICLPLLARMQNWSHSRGAVIAISSVAFILGGIWLAERILT